MQITSPAFREGEPIPVRYTCEGEDISPRLDWNGQPESTISYVIIMQDPDAPGGTFTHWIIFNIRPEALGGDWIPAALHGEPVFENDVAQGRNSFGEIGYGGPCPPPGSTHHYVFTIYALDTTLDLPAAPSRTDVLAAMEGNIAAQGQIIGTYGR